jgi:hypothetical protein
MSCHKSSIEALQQLLHLGTPDGKISDETHYGLDAYGEEANQLYKETNNSYKHIIKVLI